MFSRALTFTLIISFACVTHIYALAKTRGTPLGGMGTGYVRFDATTGDFTASGKTPPAAADGWSGADYNRKSNPSGFHLFAKDKAVKKVKTTKEDAKCPAYFAEFDKLENVTFKLTAFGPYNPGDNPENFKLATSPMALFEIMAINGNSEEVEVAAAMEFANGNLLGGAASGTVVTGNQAISFAGTNDNAHLIVGSSAESATYSAGAIGSFETNGTLANAAGNLVAAKTKVAAGDSVRFKFVLAWWRKYETTSTSRYSNFDGKENYWYHNNFDNSEKVAKFGLEKFDLVRNGIVGFINRTMASNFPDWYKDRLLNNTYPLIHNSQVTKDGRLAFWEGLYGIIGTIDQGQHAALFYTFNWPEVQWKELNYWRKTTRTGTNLGQIHHDFNKGIDNFHSNSERTAARFICPFEGNNNNQDYWWFPKTESWADLNMMFILKAYELMLATGNKDSVKAYFPAIKQTAERIITQSGSNSIPFNSHSTYDEKIGNDFTLTPEYNGSVALATYLAVEEIAKFLGETEQAQKYRELFNKGKTEYRNKFFGEIGKRYARDRDYSEGDVAGYSWANYFCLEPVFDSTFIAESNKSLWNWYNNRTESGVDNLRAKLGKWGFYTCDHWGGTEIATGNPDRAMVIHGWDHEYYYKNSPGMIYWQTLRKESNTNKNQYASYMTGPTVWRSYFQMTGYMIDNANKRLWIRPRIPSSMNNTITNALLLNPRCMGTLNYTENGAGQCIQVSYDAPGVEISEIVLKNTGPESPSVRINNADVDGTISTEGSAYEKNIRIKLSSPITIGPRGIAISVNGLNCEVGVQKPAPIRKTSIFPLKVRDYHISADCPIHYSVNVAGEVTMELISLNGAKIGTIMRDNVKAGPNTFVWNGKTINGKPVSAATVAILRISSSNAVTSKAVFTGR